jgi:hypothetical protein
MATGSLLQNPREETSKNELKGTTALSFPPEIDANVPNFFELKFVNYDRNAALKKATQSPNSVTIFLPVPIDLTDETNLDYSEYESFGGLDKLLQNGTTSDFAASLGEAAGGSLQAMALGGARYLPEATAKLGAGLASKALKVPVSAGNLGTRLGQIAGTQIGALVNPALAVEFRGIQRKSYTFTWRMVAKSADESKRINQIVDCIRWNILPEKVSGDWILTYPNIAFMKFHGNLEYGKADAPRQLIQFAPQGAVVRRMAVTYNGSSAQQVFFDQTGEPIEVAIQLELEDRGILTRELIDSSWQQGTSS